MQDVVAQQCKKSTLEIQKGSVKCYPTMNAYVHVS